MSGSFPQFGAGFGKIDPSDRHQSLDGAVNIEFQVDVVEVIANGLDRKPQLGRGFAAMTDLGVDPQHLVLTKCQISRPRHSSAREELGGDAFERLPGFDLVLAARPRESIINDLGGFERETVGPLNPARTPGGRGLGERTHRQ